MLYVGRKCCKKHQGNSMGKYVGRNFGCRHSLFVNAGIDVFLKTTTLIQGTGLLCLCAEDALK